MMTAPTPPSAGRFFREPFSTVSHLVGLILSVALLPILLFAANGRVPHTIGALAFGLGLILLYTASTLLHGVVAPPAFLRRLEKFDYAAIFALIVGTYVPVCLVTLQGRMGWSLLAGELTLALVGIVLCLARREGNSTWHRIQDMLRVGLYLAMGWLVILGAGRLFHALPGPGLAWLVAGGIVYSVGAVIFVLDRPHLLPGKFSAHDLWHLFVLTGSALHGAFIIQYVLLPGSSLGG